MKGKSLDQLLKLNKERRKICEKRGFHRIDKEPETPNSQIICYDCGLGFDKLTAIHLKIKYVVEPNWEKLFYMKKMGLMP